MICVSAWGKNGSQASWRRLSRERSRLWQRLCRKDCEVAVMSEKPSCRVYPVSQAFHIVPLKLLEKTTYEWVAFIKISQNDSLFIISIFILVHRKQILLRLVHSSCANELEYQLLEYLWIINRCNLFLCKADELRKTFLHDIKGRFV